MADIDFDIVKKEVEALENLWKNLVAKNWTEAIKFLLSSLDDLITFIEGFDLAGHTKKEVVLSAIDYFYDFVITPLLPFYVRPFTGKINDLVLFVSGIVIDFIVSKYNDGSWVVAKANHKWSRPSGGHCCN